MAENYNLIFGSNASQSYSWSDADYQKGWETVGDTPPLGEQFDALQRRADNKAKDLNDRLTPIETNNTNIFRQPSTAYALKDIRFYPELPAGWYFECKVAGITDAGDIMMPSPIIENDTVVDGTVTWKIRKISSADGMPIGAIIHYASNGDIPSGYLLCDGAAVSRTMFPDLFAAIGTTYGAGDGSTTFNVPDYNTAQRFAQGGTVAGTVKEAGLPNITASMTVRGFESTTPLIIVRSSGALAQSGSGSNSNPASSYNSQREKTNLTFDASRSSSIYGNSDTVQPNALTCRYIIKAFDGQTADSALIDITQFANELAGKANITGSNLVYHRDVITTSGTYTAPVTGLYKITVKGGGGGGESGSYTSSASIDGAGGGEGGTTIAFVKMLSGDSATVVIGAGGSGAPGQVITGDYGTDGGDSSVTINGESFIGGGGGATKGGTESAAGVGGTGTITGAPGTCGSVHTTSSSGRSGSGGGAGGGAGSAGIGVSGVSGGGGAGGGGQQTVSQHSAGGAGGNGYVWFEYYTPGA